MNARKVTRMDTPDEPLPPESALSRIDQAQNRVREGRRWQAGTLAGAGAFTLGYFALLGWSDDPDHLLNMALIMLPTFAVLAAVQAWGRRSAPRSRETARRRQRLSVAYAVLACAAGLLAVLLPHPVPAALAGVLPAVPCFVGARWAARR
jgi:hypothetical protein